MKNLLKFFGIQGKNNKSLMEDIYIDIEEEIAFAKAVDAWERSEGVLIREEAHRIAREEHEAFLNDRHELMMEYFGA